MIKSATVFSGIGAIKHAFDRMNLDHEIVDPTQCHPNYTADIREGVTVEYVSCEPPGSLKELFSEGYNADDDSFEGAETEQA